MPRIEAANLAEHRALLRARILDAFGVELTVTGFTGLTLAAVGRRAGIARNTIYNYYPDKNELMLAFVERSVADFMGRIGRQLDALDSAAERMTVLIRAQIAAFAVEPGSGSASGILEGGSLPAEVFDALMVRLSGLHGMVREVLEYGIARGEFQVPGDLQSTVEIIGSVIGSQRMAVGEHRRSVDDAVGQVVPFVLAAIGQS